MGSGTQPVAGQVGRVSIHCSLHGVLPAGAPVLHPVLVTQEWGWGSFSKLLLSRDRTGSPSEPVVKEGLRGKWQLSRVLTDTVGREERGQSLAGAFWRWQ